jgi:type II secretory ATPase GspE/PulE/Tfp pilus assembly ATPase PilB-like protein
VPNVLELNWGRGKGDAWAALSEVDLDSPALRFMQGVYVLWRGGNTPQALRVGQGDIRPSILALRTDPQVKALMDQALLKDQGLYVTWVQVDKAQRDGVHRFVAESLHPLIPSPLPDAMGIECTLPGPGGLMPFSDNVEIVRRPAAQAAPAVVAAPKVQRLTALQKRFNDLIQKAMQQPQAKGFFGGGGAAAKPEDDTIVVDAVKMMLEEGVRMRASDIHLEPMDNYLRVRFRVDGLLEEVLDIPKGSNMRVVSHIRVRCGLDPEQGLNTGKPQDGRMAVNVDGQDSDLRLSTFPTPSGDKAVLRIINHNVKIPVLEELGLRPQITALVRELINRPQGMIVVTGPAGSGKSTTLYTCLQTLNTTARNIVTLEDPIEQKIIGITQGALQPKMGFTFSEGLRSILRQDPNVIMVGEVRDKETAEIAMSAALTGHLLFTTLHTTSSLGAVTRLLDMGLEPFLISAALTAIFAQRLARRLCPNCREGYAPTTTEIAQMTEMTSRAGVPLPPALTQQLFRSKGCPSCRDTGFQGRVLVLEVVPMTTGLRQQILRKAPMDDMRKVAIQEGTVTMLMDGLDKVTQGLTTMGELVRVVGVGD